MRRRGVISIFVCGAAVVVAPGHADSNRCSVSVTPISFGNYDGLRPADVRTTGTITYNCEVSQPITISISHGGSPHGGRIMRYRGSELIYDLYLDAAGTIVWGDGTGGSQVYRDPAPPPRANVSVPVYGLVPAQQREARVGLYDDNLVVKINY